MVQRVSQEKSVQEEVEELRSALLNVRAEVRRMETCIENFRTRYEPLLEAMAVSSTYWTGLRRELGMHIAKWGALVVLGAFLAAFWGSVRGWLKGWLA